MLARVAGQAPHIAKQHPALTLGQMQIVKSPEHAPQGAQRGFIGRNREGDVGGASQEFPDLLDRLESCVVHIDHHPFNDRSKTLISASYAIGNTPHLLASYAIGRDSILHCIVLQCNLMDDSGR